jgi:hypothetical protein
MAFPNLSSERAILQPWFELLPTGTVYDDFSPLDCSTERVTIFCCASRWITRTRVCGAPSGRHSSVPIVTRGVPSRQSAPFASFGAAGSELRAIDVSTFGSPLPVENVRVQRAIVESPRSVQPTPTIPFPEPLRYASDNAGCIPARPSGTQSGT